MMTKEYCRYIRTYSELKGLQKAHTLIYCGASTPRGVLLELRCEQGGRVQSAAVLIGDSFVRAMQLLRYLCENGVELGQWLDVLDDAGVAYRQVENPDGACNFPESAGRNLDFCAICPV